MAEAKKVKQNQYEAMFLIGSAATSENESGLGLVRPVIERHGGKILFIKKWDERKLAFEVGSAKRGTYIIAFFTAPGSAIAPIERDVKLSEDLLRVLITDASHLNQQEMEAVEPQPIAPPREERPWDRPFEDRGDRGGFRPRGPRREESTEAAGAKE